MENLVDMTDDIFLFILYNCSEFSEFRKEETESRLGKQCFIVQLLLFSTSILYTQDYTYYYSGSAFSPSGSQLSLFHLFNRKVSLIQFSTAV